MIDQLSQVYEAHCFTCKSKRVLQNPEAVYSDTGVAGTRGQCMECGRGLYRRGITPAHNSLPKPQVVAKPKRKKAAKKPRGKPRKVARPRSNGARAIKPKKVGKLVIVESPAKARTIGGFLGEGYTVMSSVGHVRDLLKSRLSVDIDNDFEPEYRVPNEKRATVKELKAAAAGAEEIYLATDPDREGEAIAWHLVAAAEMPTDKIKRVVFHEITGSAVSEAFSNPRDINMDLVDAQQARRILDRLVGYQVSPLLWKKVRSGLSAGRVQSIALRLVVEREKAIQSFVPVEHWTIDALLAKASQPAAAPFKARLMKIGDDSVSFDAKRDDPPALDCEAAALPHVDVLRRSLFQVSAVKRGTRQSKPAAPFTTSTLQQAASSRLRLSASHTMRLAQQLYEGIDIGTGKAVGLITYMRTDSVQVSKDSQQAARRYITGKYGKPFLPKSPPKYKTRAKSAQEAHEAIRPTSITRSPESLAGHLDKAQLAIYRLIWQRFVASQMAPAVYDTLRIDIAAGLTTEDMPYTLRASGSKLKLSGHLAVSGAEKADEPQPDFPDLQAGELLERRQILPEQHFTQPPPRYAEATLIRQLEDKGIGRPSTYAPTVSIIQTRDYVSQEQRRLKPTKTGFVVCELLSEFFAEEMDYAFTARMEDQLDAVSSGKLLWKPMLGEFYAPFEQRLQYAEANMPRRDVAEKVGRGCPRCEEGELLVKHSRYGKFIGCSRYPECKHTERYLDLTGQLCPICGDEQRGEVVRKRSRKGRSFYGCSRYPDCDFTAWRLPRGLKPVEAAEPVAG
ncbi:MAG: type I DNA topoisomerase [Chloroflexi bacterium]|nr:type I DNA topoisomerase [Chloroflexota bacterium]MCY3583187.1 type I DNA topoisomerase [Chloroflexota bacterium]MXV91904.1 type I DNA topoisomerase [Chloroflexota bacterium]MXX51263.1 type I DNA topoisomerase [Chloroflexota bacterium]MXX84126.1 type I DNA topoisomerase [Chloroflexota bacterium]